MFSEPELGIWRWVKRSSQWIASSHSIQCWTARLFVCLFVRLFVCLFVCLLACLFVCFIIHRPATIKCQWCEPGELFHSIFGYSTWISDHYYEKATQMVMVVVTIATTIHLILVFLRFPLILLMVIMVMHHHRLACRSFAVLSGGWWTCHFRWEKLGFAKPKPLSSRA